MQLQFEKQGISCLQTVKRELQSQEQTLEVRVSDGMPDIGSIIGSWGQVILRSKEWQGDGMTVSGGTMVWVRYLPEDGGPPRCLESWLPFQLRWSFPPTRHDGNILVRPFLTAVDARTLSSRKMMLRANVSVVGWAMEKETVECCGPVQVPEDVQLRRDSYPVELPVEAGEKAFQLEETVTLPPSAPPVDQITGYTLQPEITEEKMVGDKVVFRGNAVLHLHYTAADGGQYAWDFDLPFTQYSELDAEYGEDGSVLMWPCVTSLELDREDGQLQVKAGLVCQYRISCRRMLEVVSDAYSPRRTVEAKWQELKLPGILERKAQIVHARKSAALEGMHLIDTVYFPQPVSVQHSPDSADMKLTGKFQILYYDMDGKLKTAVEGWEEHMQLPIGEGTAVTASLWPTGKTQGTLLSGSTNLSEELTLSTETVTDRPIPMITALELGELQQPDARRPSLILRRAGGEDLWKLAKHHGSSVESIRTANNLEGEPEASQMLLIPVL